MYSFTFLGLWEYSLAHVDSVLCSCWQDFLVTFKNHDEFVAPGLGVVAVVEYLARDEQDKYDVIGITIDGCSLEIPVRALVYLLHCITIASNVCILMVQNLTCSIVLSMCFTLLFATGFRYIIKKL